MRAAVVLSILCTLLACTRDRPAPDSVPPLMELLGTADVSGFERALESHPFAFPEDHRSHPGFKSEWWYFTGYLTDESGAMFGFQLTFFRFALKPGETGVGSDWRSKDVWMGHFSVTDVSRGQFYFGERLSRDGMALAGNAGNPFSLWVEDWRAEASGVDAFPLRVRAGTNEAAIDLTLTATRAPVAHGDRGLDRKGPELGNASFYYSVPRLAAAGNIDIGASRFAVSGSAWMDREWSSNALSPELDGWDWFYVELSNGSDLMVYRLRTTAGGASPFSSGSLVSVDGRRIGLTPESFTLSPTDTWTSPVTGARYPISWRLTIPNERMELSISAKIPNQEMDLSIRYWEGIVDAAGSSAGGPVTGTGYLELTGY